MAIKEVLRVLWTAVFLSLVTSAVIKNHANLPGHEFLKTVNESEKADFLTFKLGLGYEEEFLTNESLNRHTEEEIVLPDDLHIAQDLLRKFETLQAPDNFSRNLFSFVKTEFDLDRVELRTLILSRTICFLDGRCIDIDDVGSLCCPF